MALYSESTQIKSLVLVYKECFYQEQLNFSKIKIYEILFLKNYPFAFTIFPPYSQQFFTCESCFWHIKNKFECNVTHHNFKRKKNNIQKLVKFSLKGISEVALLNIYRHFSEKVIDEITTISSVFRNLVQSNSNLVQSYHSLVYPIATNIAIFSLIISMIYLLTLNQILINILL